MYREGILSLFCKLVSIDSESYHEDEMRDYLRGRLEELGLEVTDNAGNLYGLLRANEEGHRPVLLSAHMDTVSPGVGKMALVDEDRDIITSAGDTVLGSDDAAGITAILEGIRAVQESGYGHGDVEVLFTWAEEAYCRGASELDFGGIMAKDAYVIDMSGRVGNAALAAPSIISIRFEIRGRAAHSGFDPAAGINAIAAAAEIIAGTRQGLIADGLTLNIGTISGGTASNIVPDAVSCTGEVRGNDHEAAVRATEELGERVESVAAAYGAESSFESKVMIQAYRTDESSDVCRAFTEACRNIGVESSFTTTRGGSDNNVFSQHGIDGIVVGCGMMNTHTTQEYINISELVRSAELVREIIRLR